MANRRAIIGAYFSGIASVSLHGWCWLVAAFLGSIIGTGLRPLFGLTVEYETSQPGLAIGRYWSASRDG
jgi:hypothetical protein